MSTKIILGPPGTGKTEYLLRKVEKKLEEGIKPGRIGYFAYTVKAANEARTRAIKKFTNLDKKDFNYFRTLHSLAFKQLGLSKELAKGLTSNKTPEEHQEDGLSELSIFCIY